jgi:hypothetical protein
MFPFYRCQTYDPSFMVIVSNKNVLATSHIWFELRKNKKIPRNLISFNPRHFHHSLRELTRTNKDKEEREREREREIERECVWMWKREREREIGIDKDSKKWKRLEKEEKLRELKRECVFVVERERASVGNREMGIDKERIWWVSETKREREFEWVFVSVVPTAATAPSLGSEVVCTLVFV